MAEPMDVLRVADVLNLAGIKIPGVDPITDESVLMRCSACLTEQLLSDSRLGPSEMIGMVSEYRCRSCQSLLASTGHHGLLSLPDGDAMVRLGEYVIKPEVDLRLLIPDGPSVVLPSTR